MITNEREYRITRAQARELERALEEGQQGPVPEDIHPTLAAAAREGLRGELDELKRQLEEFDHLRNGRKRIWVVESLGKLPDVIIQARIAAGMTQKQFADQLQLKEQQVQRYESTRYHGVSLERIEQAGVAAGLQFQIACARALPQGETLSGQWSILTEALLPINYAFERGISVIGSQTNVDFASVAPDVASLNAFNVGGNVVINYSNSGRLAPSDKVAALSGSQIRPSVTASRERLGMDANRSDIEIAI